MRLATIAMAVGLLASCAGSADNMEQRETVRLEPRFGVLSLIAGSDEEDSSFSFNITYNNSPAELGSPRSVTWTVRFRDYCLDRDSWVQSVLIGPAGEIWYGYRVDVPAGLVRGQDWSSGATGAERYGGPATPGLMDAIQQGGEFTLALEDDTGRRFNSVVIDTLSPPKRDAMFDSLAVEDRTNQPVPLMVAPGTVAPLPRPGPNCIVR